MTPTRQKGESNKAKESRKLRQELESLKRKAAKIQEKLDKHITDDAIISGGLMDSEEDDDVFMIETKIEGKGKGMADERIQIEGNRCVSDRRLRP